MQTVIEPKIRIVEGKVTSTWLDTDTHYALRVAAAKRLMSPHKLCREILTKWIRQEQRKT